MTRILILNNLFNFNLDYLPNFLIKFLLRFNRIKLKSLIQTLKKKNNNSNFIIEVITPENEKFSLNNHIRVNSLSDLRNDINHSTYLSIKEQIIRNTKKNFHQLYKNLLTIKLFHYNRIFIGKILEFIFALFINDLFGRFELIKNKIQNEYYDKIILNNCNPNAINFFHSLNKDNKNIEIYNDKLILKKYSLFKWTNIVIYFLITLISYVKTKLIKSTKNKIDLKKIKRYNIVFNVETKNQFESIKPVYDKLKKYENYNPIIYTYEHFLSFNRIFQILRFLFQIRRSLIKNYEKISMNLNYDSIKLKNVLKTFYDFFLYIYLIRIFNVYNNLIEFFKKCPPSLVIIPNDFLPVGRLTAKYLKERNIPTLYLPHAAIAIFDEFVTKFDFSYIAVPGNYDKKFFLEKGEYNSKIMVTGRPRYDFFYLSKPEKLTEIQDIINNKLYKFNSIKKTILLTTNPIGNQATELLLTKVINCLKKLNLVDYLIIKLHPLEDINLYKEILDKLKVSPTVVKDYNILSLINSCDILLSRISTTILEAMLIGKPVIALDLINLNFKYTGKYLFMENDVLKKVYDEDSLIKNLKNLIDNNELRLKYSEDLKNLAKHYSFYDKNESSTQRIVKLIKDIVNL